MPPRNPSRQEKRRRLNQQQSRGTWLASLNAKLKGCLQLMEEHCLKAMAERCLKRKQERCSVPMLGGWTELLQLRESEDVRGCASCAWPI